MSDVLGLAVFTFIVFVLGVGCGSRLTSDVYKAQAVKRGYAQYCPDDGAWAWKGECEK